MDVAMRVQPRERGDSYLNRQRGALPEDSGNESESFVRRKFQRTANDAEDTNATFRKPSQPASASASRPAAEQRSSFTHNRRRSTLRENARVPSGPRDFPSPSKRVGSVSSLAPSIGESTSSARSLLPQSTSEPFYSRTGDASRTRHAHLSSFANDDPPHDTSADTASDQFDFMPTVNFDDLHNSIANYDGNGPLLSEFPVAGGTRAGTKDSGTVQGYGFAASNSQARKLEPREEPSSSRSASLRRRLSAVTGGKQNSLHTTAKDGLNVVKQPNGSSLRNKRQSTAPQGAAPAGHALAPNGTTSRAPRKSAGPGSISSLMEGRKASQPMPPSTADLSSRTGLSRTDSLNKSPRRTTMQATASEGAELPRISTLNATTQSRANKVKSLQPPPREQDSDAPYERSPSKNNQHRAQTPSSSGNRRQSVVSGRASGLGARTVSPTDARRLKRLSMMQAPPPLPNHSTKHNPPTPQDEMPQMKLELPRLAQPSPSLIPRKTSNATPTSARASPEGRSGLGSGASLNTKSSHQSLLTSSGSTSRLPTPKPRNAHSSSAQYPEEEETVPPVPAIPKAYESPRETDRQFFTGALKSSQSGFGIDGNLSNTGFDLDPAASAELPSSSVETLAEARKRPSTDLSRVHQRTNTFENIERSANMPMSSSSRPHFDTNGRKNSNLQPLRLPPLNLMPIHQTSTKKGTILPRPSQEVEKRDQYVGAQTPEPRRVAKTPSTPMTASKATFYRRQDEEQAKQKAMRSSSSHFALRDLMQLDDRTTQFFDDSDLDFMGTDLPNPSRQRSAITPFSSGSLPKASGEFSRQLARPSGEYDREYTMTNFENFQLQSAKPQGPRPSRSGTKDSFKTAETSSSHDSPAIEPSASETKKESSSGGLRRKLSLSWRRSSSKSSNHPDHKSSPQEHPTSDRERHKLHKRISQMPPPKLPASATWTGELPTVPVSTARPSLDSFRRKSGNASITSLVNADGNTESEQATPTHKTKSLHSEQPQAVNLANRAHNWTNTNIAGRSSAPKAQGNAPRNRQASAGSNWSVLVKAKDDLAADEEMKRLSQKRKDVDTAARETEELWKRAVPASPMTPERVLHDRTCILNIFERGEIMDYEKEGIYFTGNKAARKIIGSLTPSPQPSAEKDAKTGNYGYDDERGDYNIVLGDHLAYRYEVVDILGKGSFGQVVRCIDHKEGGIVAVKIIRNKKRFHQQALVEVGILGRLRDWDPDGAHATLSITTSFYFRSHLCIVTPCLSINLYELIRAHNFVGFSLPLIRRFARQLLSCLALLQSKRIIHCDLKPENILLCEARKADVRVIDFGSSCKEEEKVYTYIQSRFYRSPEVILGSSYGLGIDMWSLGCILAELWTGYPLFPGENEQEQLACIMEIFGPPDRHLVDRCTRKKLFFDSVGKPRVTVSSKGRRRRPSSKTLSQALKTEDEAFLDFITRCLRWDPDRRLKPQDAIHHPFITNQPLAQRPGIPDEARRAARLRSTAAVPAASNSQGSNSSPMKRVHTTAGVAAGSANAFAQQQAQQTPAKEKNRPLPETPQTALRNGVHAANAQTQGSPSKQLGSNRRHSTMPNANSAAVAGSKRGSNGALVTGTSSSGQAAQRQGSGNSGVNLAQMAAREANASRWRP